MKCVGSQVFHEKYGSGIISAQYEKMIDVQFREKTNHDATFVFPTVFLGDNPFLTTEDEPLASYIKKISATQGTCIFCKKRMPTSLLLNSEHLCENCQKNLRPCSQCNSLTDFHTDIYREYKLCEDCFNKKYFKCSVCGEIFIKDDDMLTDVSFIPKGEKWCYSCANDRGYCACEECGKYYLDSELTEIENYHYFCAACLLKRAKVCTECGRMYLSADEKENKNLCRECNRKKSYLDTILQIDFKKLKIKRISAYELKRSSTVTLMTKLHTTAEMATKAEKWGGKQDYCDVLLINLIDTELVVVYGYPFPTDKIPLGYESATMTEFKKGNKAYWLAVTEHELLATSSWSEDIIFELWKTPFRLCAQTNYDTDYRKEWRGDYLEYEGNNYGDTSDFWIIGTLKKVK